MPRVSATGAAITTAVAGLFALGASVMLDETTGEEARVECAGVNSCAGQASGAGAANACQGRGACGSDTVLELSREECEHRGGTVTG